MPLGATLGIRMFGDADEVDATLDWAPELCTAGGDPARRRAHDARRRRRRGLRLPQPAGGRRARRRSSRRRTSSAPFARARCARSRARSMSGRRRSSWRRICSTRRVAAWRRPSRRRPSSPATEPALSCRGHGGGSSVGRAPGCGPGGRGFESRPPPEPSAVLRSAHADLRTRQSLKASASRPRNLASRLRRRWVAKDSLPQRGSSFSR